MAAVSCPKPTVAAPESALVAGKLPGVVLEQEAADTHDDDHHAHDDDPPHQEHQPDPDGGGAEAQRQWPPAVGTIEALYPRALRDVTFVVILGQGLDAASGKQQVEGDQ